MSKNRFFFLKVTNGNCATVDDKRAILCSPSQNEQKCWDFHVKNYFQTDKATRSQTNLPHSNGGVVSYQNDVIIVAGNGPSSSNLATEMNKGSEWITQTDINNIILCSCLLLSIQAWDRLSQF